MMSFNQAVHRYHPLLVRQALALTGNSADAEDVVQDGWIISWRGWDGILATDSLVACLRNNTYRAFIFWKRTRTTVKRGRGDSGQRRPGSNGHARDALGDRDSEDMAALAMGYSLAEIGADRGVTGERIRQRMAVARTRLRLQFDSRPDSTFN